jgi:hypothetical protein
MLRFCISAFLPPTIHAARLDCRAGRAGKELLRLFEKLAAPFFVVGSLMMIQKEGKQVEGFEVFGDSQDLSRSLKKNIFGFNLFYFGNMNSEMFQHCWR